ncbi:MAG: hypothetical protein WBA23_07295 [Tunicatimonas sp.]|uniref:hypothetical protein n=1 Tax=Tunicatimonas sp. TaxID=1940096 RepID=UPI003C723774
MAIAMMKTTVRPPLSMYFPQWAYNPVFPSNKHHMLGSPLLEKQLDGNSWVVSTEGSQINTPYIQKPF